MSQLKACPHWTANALKPNRIQFERIHTECAFNRLNLNPNSFPEVVSIQIDLDCAISRCMHVRGPKRVWHARTCQLSTVSALLQATHCLPRICSAREAI